MSTYTIPLAEGHFSGATAIQLTDERAESSYGQPVAILIGGPNNGTAYGPEDIIPSGIPDDPLEWLTEPARTTVAVADLAARRAAGCGPVWGGEGNKPELLREGAAIDEAVMAFCGLREICRAGGEHDHHNADDN